MGYYNTRVSDLGEILKRRFLNGKGVITQGPGPYPKSVIQKIGPPYINKGYDIAVDVGTPVNTQGLQFLGSWWDKTGYGTRAAYYDPKENQTYFFSHLSKVQRTPQGTQIYTGGIPGIHGRSTGPHLDINYKPGKVLNDYGPVRQTGQVGQTTAYPSISYSRNKINPQDILKLAMQKFGSKRVRAVGSRGRLSELQRKFGGRLVRL